ncbi:MAG: SPFH domain-containing protein, partial [Actinomycetota bacterium]|nr:SPFH domain-containing protein [Actinomycetota bacterium]
MGAWVVVAVFAAVVVLGLAIASLRIIKEYERGVAFRLGRLRGPLGPGIAVVLPGVDKLVRVDLRTVTLTIPPQEVITRDNVTARVNAVVLFRVTDPTKSVMAV